MKLLVLVLAALLLAGCAMESPAPSGDATTTAIAIQGFAFLPGTARMKVGQTITLTNKDSASHRLVWDGKPAGSALSDSSNLGKDATFTFVPDVAGTYTYHCGIHSSMKGTLVVSN